MRMGPKNHNFITRFHHPPTCSVPVDWIMGSLLTYSGPIRFPLPGPGNGIKNFNLSWANLWIERCKRGEAKCISLYFVNQWTKKANVYRGDWCKHPERNRKEKWENLDQDPEAFLILVSGCSWGLAIFSSLNSIKHSHILGSILSLIKKLTNTRGCFQPSFTCKENWDSGKPIVLQVLMAVFLDSVRAPATQVKLE